MNDYESTLNMVRNVAEINTKIGLDLDVKLCEEMGELLTALMQTKTYKALGKIDNGWNEVREECADVIVSIMVMLYRVEAEKELDIVNSIIDSKLKRTIKRYENGGPV